MLQLMIRTKGMESTSAMTPDSTQEFTAMYAVFPKAHLLHVNSIYILSRQ